MKRFLLGFCVLITLCACTGRSKTNLSSSSDPVHEIEPSSNETSENTVLGEETSTDSNSVYVNAPETIPHIKKEITSNIRIDADIKTPKEQNYNIVEIEDVPFAEEDLIKLKNKFGVNPPITDNGAGRYSFIDESTMLKGYARPDGINFTTEVTLPLGRISKYPFNLRNAKTGDAAAYFLNTLSFQNVNEALNQAVDMVGDFTKNEISIEDSLIFGLEKSTLEPAYEDWRFKYSPKCDDGVYYLLMPFQYNGLSIYCEDLSYEFVGVPGIDDESRIVSPPYAEAAISSSGIENFSIYDNFQITNTISENSKIISLDAAINTLSQKMENILATDVNVTIFSISLQYVRKPKSFSGNDINTAVLAPAWVFEGVQDYSDDYLFPHVEFIDAITGKDMEIQNKL